MAVELSFCVVNTEQRELLVRCLDAIAAERDALPFSTEVLVLDNASNDGSAGAARRHPVVTEVIALRQRRGKGENDTALLQRARGRFALLLNEDSELRPGAVAALHEALTGHPKAAAAGAALFRPDGAHQPSAWRFPTPGTALVGALFLHRRLTVQSRGDRTRKVDWAQSAALLVRVEAARAIGYFDPAFFVYSDEVDFCKRLRTRAGARSTSPPRWPSTTSSSRPAPCPSGGSSSSRATATATCASTTRAMAAGIVRVLTAWAYAVRSLAALVVPGHNARRYWRHVTATLRPDRGEGLREAAVEHNRGRRL